MATWIRKLSLTAVAIAFLPQIRAANLDGSSQEVGNAEAARLYSEANAFVSNMSEGEYSYDYLQFYWKRAQSNIDRIRRVYPTSPTALALDQGDLAIGPYSLDYFKNNVLYNLELKRLGSFDDVNCAIFLYGRSESRNDPRRDAALASILEVLSRRQRWEEALRFPVLSVHRPLLLRSIYRVAALYGAADVAKRIRANATPAERSAAGFDELDAEAIALQARPRAELYDFVRRHPGDSVRAAALSGVVEREEVIRRFERTHTSFRESIQTTHLPVQHTTFRDNVAEVATALYAADLEKAAPVLAVYSAAEGQAPAPDAPPEAHAAYLEYLFQDARMDPLATYVSANGLRGEARRLSELKIIELYAKAGDRDEAQARRKSFAAEHENGADDAALAEFRGRAESTVVKLEARKDTFADLPISDPCVMAEAIMDWSLTPNRSQRGAVPWDALVMRFAGGFDHLPRPKSAEVGDAASTLKPY